jgi:hypothetical protein
MKISPAGYVRYLSTTLAKMRQRRAAHSRSRRPPGRTQPPR